ADLVEDDIGALGPDERSWFLVVCREVVRDCPFQFGDAAERVPADAALGDLGEEPFDLIEPRAAGRSEVRYELGVPHEPVPHARVLVLWFSRKWKTLVGAYCNPHGRFPCPSHACSVQRRRSPFSRSISARRCPSPICATS